MNVKNLKLLAGTVIYKSEKLSEASKIQLLNFIKESDSYDIMSLLLDRKIMKIDETAKTILEDRFMKSKYGRLLEGLTFTTAGKIISYSKVIRNKTAKTFSNSCNAMEKKYKNSKKFLDCVAKAIEKSTKAQILFLKTNIKNCPNEKCKKSITNYISRIEKRSNRVIKGLK